MTQFNMTDIKDQSRKDMLATIKAGLSKALIGNALKAGWYVDSMKVSFCESYGTAVYVRLAINNSCGIIFFDDLPRVEKAIKELVKDADNFTLGSGTLFKPRVGFVV